MISPRIALVAIARTTFDIELAAQQTAAVRAHLTRLSAIHWRARPG